MRSIDKKNNNMIKILHIGNIANNAYQNAKILNDHGYENIVLSFDYYHVMGCPEWDDASIDGEIKNQNYPQWHKVKLNGFRRPDWFVAAPLRICIKYINAYCQGKTMAALFWQKVANISRRYISDRESGEIGFVSILFKILIALKRIIYLVCISVYLKCKKILGFDINDSYNGKSTEMGVRDRVELDFKELFPDRKCEFGKDLDGYIEVGSYLEPLLDSFDVIFAYATNPIYMYLLGKKDYIAYEHGTIRDLPYEDSDMGRLMLLSYAKAKAIYCTNIDCYESAKYITQKTGTPIICGLHGIDIGALINKIDSAKNEKYNISDLINLINRPLFFSPARHSWDAQRMCYLKGEDKFLRAASRIAAQGNDFTIIMVEWGDNTKDIKTIIDANEDLKKHVKWIQPLSKKELYYLYSQSDAVLDQFVLKAYGAISFEVLASGKPVLISAGAEESLEKQFFGEKVLHYPCYEEDEIFDAMMEVIKKTERYLDYSQKGRKWIEDHHSKECIYRALEKAMGA